MQKIVLGISGGVDSTLSAGLLREQGFDVLGVYLDMGYEDKRAAAERAAKEAGVDFESVDISRDMEETVCAPFVAGYLSGRTPSPCLVCNAGVKFPILLREADRRGIEKVATGHYAKTDYGGGRWRLLRSEGSNDQSYMLGMLSQEILSRVVFPLGGFDKEQVRALAADRGYSSASQPDSMELCFIPDGNYEEYLKRRAGTLKQGVFADTEGNTLAPHGGIGLYTVGQRKGLGTFGKPMYVLDVDPETARVTVGPQEALYRKAFFVTDINMVSDARLEQGEALTVRVRHSRTEANVILYPAENGECLVECCEKIRAPAPGQAAVFYRGSVVVAAGWIARGRT